MDHIVSNRDSKIHSVALAVTTCAQIKTPHRDYYSSTPRRCGSLGNKIYFARIVANETNIQIAVNAMIFHLLFLIFFSTIHLGTKVRKLYIETARGIASNIIGKVKSNIFFVKIISIIKASIIVEMKSCFSFKLNL